jgi:hypothetical protein
MRTSFRHQSEAQPPNGPLTGATSPRYPIYMASHAVGPADALPATIRYTRSPRSPSTALEALEHLGEFRPVAASAADLLGTRH